jgi:hypothetical protein
VIHGANGDGDRRMIVLARRRGKARHALDHWIPCAPGTSAAMPFSARLGSSSCIL